MLIQRWSISSGYMTFLVLDLLNDIRPKSRNQIVLNALRSRKYPEINKQKFYESMLVTKIIWNCRRSWQKDQIKRDFVESWKDIKIPNFLSKRF